MSPFHLKMHCKIILMWPRNFCSFHSWPLKNISVPTAHLPVSCPFLYHTHSVLYLCQMLFFALTWKLLRLYLCYICIPAVPSEPFSSSEPAAHPASYNFVIPFLVKLSLNRVPPRHPSSSYSGQIHCSPVSWHHYSSHTSRTSLRSCKVLLIWCQLT